MKPPGRGVGVHGPKGRPRSHSRIGWAERVAHKGGPHNLFIYPYAESDGAPVRVSSRFRFKEK